nr:unnamed protein product [Spirometra erinaceieuropaei]
MNQSATILKPLYRLEKNRCWHWSEVEQSALEQAKAALTSSSVLVHDDPEKPTILKFDASPYGVGEVLMHRMPSGADMPIAFASRTISQAETNYSQLDKEALAIMFGLHRFHLYLFGQPFEIHTDHKPLLGSIHIHTTVTHPDANERVKQFNRQLKASLRAADDPDIWTDPLPLSLLGISSSRRLDLDCSTAQLVFGVTVRLPGEMISPTPRVAIEDPANLLHRLRQFTRTPPPVPPRPSVSKPNFG